MNASHSDDNTRKPVAWVCSACTWPNENEHGLACLMCQTERRITTPLIQRRQSRTSASQTSAPECDAGTPDVTVDGSDSIRNGPDLRSQARLPAARRDDVSKHDFQPCDPLSLSSEEPAAETSGEHVRALDDKKAAGGGNGKWDAFASFENNYQSSDDDENDASDQDDDRSDDGRKASGSRGSNGNEQLENGAGGNQWDAFKSFEQNYESSEEEEYDSSSDEGSLENRDDMEAEANFEEEEEYDDQPCLSKSNGEKSRMKNDDEVECVDLMDSDDGDSDSELEIVDMPGKENNKTDKQSSRPQRSQKKESYALGGDSDSSLSEVESRRPLPSPSMRPPPSWQRRRSTSTTPIKQDDTLKSSDFFSCMSRRNDVIGGAGAGVNGFSMAKRKGEESAKAKTAKRKSRKSSSSATDVSKKTATKTTTKRKRRSTTSKASSDGKAPAKRRKRRSYKRKSTGRRSSTNARTSTGSAANGNAWGARERGIRQPYRRGGGSSGGASAPYMNIAKQEPMLRNVGGASIHF